MKCVKINAYQCITFKECNETMIREKDLVKIVKYARCLDLIKTAEVFK